MLLAVLTGGGLVKLITCSNIGAVDIGWTCGGVAQSRKKCKFVSEPSKATTDHRMTEWSTSYRLSRVQKATPQLYRRNMPLLHMSRYIIIHDDFTRRSSAIVLQATNSGPGDKAIRTVL